MSLVVGFGPNTDQTGALFLLHKMLQAGKAAAAAEHARAIRGDDAAVRLDLSDDAKAVLESKAVDAPATPDGGTPGRSPAPRSTS
jgi:hypothetical protein